jgi:LysM repeat protein
MADGRRPPDVRDRSRGGRTAPKAYRHPVYGGQVRRDRQTGPYIIGFILVVVAIAAFLYVGLNWATGQSRVAALANPATSTPIVVVTPLPSPSPTVAEPTYIVQAGDSPAYIAQQFRVKTEDLMAANNIDDPSKLQVGQKLKIPSTPTPNR